MQGLKTEDVDKLSSLEQAFEMLLQPLATCVTRPVVILIDALDEADPVEQQRAGFDGGVRACGNQARLCTCSVPSALPPVLPVAPVHLSVLPSAELGVY